MGQPGYSILSRSGKYTHWLHLYNDNIKKKQVKYEYNLAVKYNIYFFFKYSSYLFKTHWFNYNTIFNDKITIKVIKNIKNICIKSLFWKYNINYFSILNKSYYYFKKFKNILLDSEVYIISFVNVICIYWFWGVLNKPIKKKKKHYKKFYKHKKFKKNLSQFVYIYV